MRWWWILVMAAAVAAGAVAFFVSKEVVVPEHGPVSLGVSEKRLLLHLAREALAAHLAGQSPPSVEEALLAPVVREEAPCFVTLTQRGALRGCILDSFAAHEPIYRNIQRNVVLAATADPRFPPVRAAELGSLTIEISILGSPYPLEFEDPDDLIRKLSPGIDGVILTTTYGTSTFLPQVWEQLPDPQVFLAELCRKHGAPSNAWRTDALLRIEVYQVNHFSEPDAGLAD